MVYFMHLYFIDTLDSRIPTYVYSSMQINAMNIGLRTEIETAMYLIIVDILIVI